MNDDRADDAEVWARLSPATQDLLKADPNAPLTADTLEELTHVGASAWWTSVSRDSGRLRLPEHFQDYVTSLDRREGDINS
jgi:PIN domain nuclease of toxin-antitoxin system